jgi:hypothetical protein
MSDASSFSFLSSSFSTDGNITITLKGGRSKKYCGVVNDGGMVCDRDRVGSGETFTIESKVCLYFSQYSVYIQSIFSMKVLLY